MTPIDWNLGIYTEKDDLVLALGRVEYFQMYFSREGEPLTRSQTIFVRIDNQSVDILLHRDGQFHRQPHQEYTQRGVSRARSIWRQVESRFHYSREGVKAAFERIGVTVDDALL